MKILHIIDSLGMGGAENLLIGLAGEQKAKGHYVTVSPLVCPKHTPVRDKIEAKGIFVKPLANGGSMYSPAFIWKIAKDLGLYDIVHVHLFPALYWVAIAKIFTFSKVPLVYTEHSTNNKRRNSFFFHHIDKFIYKNCYKKIIACAHKAFDTYKEAFPTITHICTINNGVDTNIYKNAEPYKKKELIGDVKDGFVITMVARFMSMKRQDTIVEALAKTPNQIHAVFVGGEEKDAGLIRVKLLAEEKGVSSRVHFLYIRNDVPRILKTSDVIVMASDYEGLSLSSIEGMAAGKPFIATDVNGLKEVVGGAGVLYENRDSEELAKIIEMLYSDEEYYKRIAEKCTARANKYDIKKVAEAYLGVYDEVIKR